MHPYGETQFTGKYGYFQNRGGFQSLSGMRGREYRSGKTPHEMSDANKTEVKKVNVPGPVRLTTKADAVDKDLDTTQPETISPVVTEG